METEKAAKSAKSVFLHGRATIRATSRPARGSDLEAGPPRSDSCRRMVIPTAGGLQPSGREREQRPGRPRASRWRSRLSLEDEDTIRGRVPRRDARERVPEQLRPGPIRPTDWQAGTQD